MLHPLEKFNKQWLEIEARWSGQSATHHGYGVFSDVTHSGGAGFRDHTHIWMNKEMRATPLRPGDVVRFRAKVELYTKGGELGADGKYIPVYYEAGLKQVREFRVVNK